MLIETDTKEYRQHFPFSPNPYISEQFLDLVKGKADSIVRLIEDQVKVSIGLVAGIRDQVLISAFSSPFGGFHFLHNNIFTSEIDKFLSKLISYTASQNLKAIKISLPPDIYHQSFNSKIANSLLRNGFSMDIPEITNWVDLKKFSGEFSCRNTKRNYNQSLRHKLSFQQVFTASEKEAAYNIVCLNRLRLGYPIYMTFADFQETGKLWPVDFFQVRSQKDDVVAAAIFYRGHPTIVQGIYWGDSVHGRRFRAMDFCSLNLWNHYKNLDFEFIDLGISSESGFPKNGLVRFKEDIDCISGLRLCFTLNLTHAHRIN
ncbi:MAG: hypothetical protein WCL21_13885 [Mariniphaga sp.]